MVTLSNHGVSGITAEKGGNFFRKFRHTLVSVELLTEMRLPRSSRSSRRVILKASITSVILLSIAFIITYSVMLSYISNRAQMMRHQDGSSPEKSKSGKRTKLLPRPFEVFGGEHVLKMLENTQAVIKWNIESFEDLFSAKPKCAANSKFVVLITSAPQNHDRREALRQTWCNAANFNLPIYSWQCVFLIGQTTDRPTQIIIQNEISTHKDILIGSYIDSYRNLTVKVMQGLHWASSACSSQYVLKTDDDVFVNAKVLYDMVTKSRTPETNVYIGSINFNPERLAVIRNTANKWSVSYEIYSDSHYPPYASGMGYFLSGDVIKRMLDEYKYVSPIPNEDAYIGVLASRVNVKPVNSARFTLSASGLRQCNYVYLIVIHHIHPSLQLGMMNRSIEAETQCASEKDNYLTWR